MRPPAAAQIDTASRLADDAVLAACQHRDASTPAKRIMALVVGELTFLTAVLREATAPTH